MDSKTLQTSLNSLYSVIIAFRVGWSAQKMVRSGHLISGPGKHQPHESYRLQLTPSNFTAPEISYYPEELNDLPVEQFNLPLGTGFFFLVGTGGPPIRRKFCQSPPSTLCPRFLDQGLSPQPRFVPENLKNLNIFLCQI